MAQTRTKFAENSSAPIKSAPSKRGIWVATALGVGVAAGTVFAIGMSYQLFSQDAQPHRILCR
jgi:hypothetical protein